MFVKCKRGWICINKNSKGPDTFLYDPKDAESVVIKSKRAQIGFYTNQKGSNSGTFGALPD